jgi:hypothetical protein
MYFFSLSFFGANILTLDNYEGNERKELKRKGQNCLFWGRGMPGWIAELDLSPATQVRTLWWLIASVEGVAGRAYYRKNPVPSVVDAAGYASLWSL